MVSHRWRFAVVGLDGLRVLLLGAIPATLAWFWLTWPQSPTPAMDVPTPIVSETVAEVAHDLAWYAPLWERDLKQPPIPPVVQRPTTPSTPVQLPVLLATLVEPHGRYAHFQGRTGAAEMKGLDETIDRFKVRAIEPGRVQLEGDSGLVWVQIPKAKEGS